MIDKTFGYNKKESSYYILKNILRTAHKSIELLKDKRDIKILDVGCGDKPYEEIFKNHLSVKEYVGVDYYNNQKADIKVDLNKEFIPMDDNYFNLVISTQVLEHLYNPLHTINEIRRVVKDNGIILITVPLLGHEHDKKYDFLRYTKHFYNRLFKELGDEIIYMDFSNYFLSTPLLIFCSMLSHIFPKSYIYTPIWKIAEFLDYLSIKLFKDRYITHSYYINLGMVVRVNKNPIG